MDLTRCTNLLSAPDVPAGGGRNVPAPADRELVVARLWFAGEPDPLDLPAMIVQQVGQVAELQVTGPDGLLYLGWFDVADTTPRPVPLD